VRCQVDVEKAPHWNSRGHFFAAAAEAMPRTPCSLDSLCSLPDDMLSRLEMAYTESGGRRDNAARVRKKV
jgi:hypothetical protein